ncbi:hypothetical protein ACLB2K_048567 [Fragaria x ananassa]
MINIYKKEYPSYFPPDAMDMNCNLRYADNFIETILQLQHDSISETTAPSLSGPPQCQAVADSLNAGTTGGRVWARTGCNFDASGHGSCQTGDCGGLLECQAYGQPPNTLAEYGLNQFNNLDFIDISLVDGFNVAMDFSPTSPCDRGIQCTADINGQCPNELKAPGGCNNPCTVYKTDEYCCNSGSCGPTDLSRFFKERCPDAYSYPKDDTTSTVVFTCPGGTNYRVVFCP